MKTRHFVAALLLTGCTGVAVLGLASPLVPTNFTWSGHGADDDWDNNYNWCPGGRAPCAFNWPGKDPEEQGDTATFPWNSSGAWACDLTDEVIGAMTLRGSVDFNTAGGAPTLSVASLTIEATSGDVEVSVSGTTEIFVP